MEDALQTKWTDEALLGLVRDGYKVECIGGELVMSPAGSRHGDLAVRIAAALYNVAVRHKLGRVLDSSTGFRMRSGNVRSPDVSFLGKERLKGLAQLPEGFFEGAPDLAVEILSPTDTLVGLHERLVEYFASGTRRAWVVNPVEATVLVYHGAEQPERLLRRGERLSDETMLPGFELALDDLFADLDF
jgi:Uma2 family endonuclease